MKYLATQNITCNNRPAAQCTPTIPPPPPPQIKDDPGCRLVHNPDCVGVWILATIHYKDIHDSQLLITDVKIFILYNNVDRLRIL
jgi:hypothetical protein